MVEDNKQEILNWLKTHRSVGDERASRVWDFSEHHGKHKDVSTAQGFLTDELQKGDLVHPDGSPIDPHTHNALRAGLNVQRGVAEQATRADGRQADAQQRAAEAAEQTSKATQKTAGKLNRLLSGIRGFFRKGGAGAKGAALGAKAASGAAVGAGLGAGSAIGRGMGNIIVKTGQDVVSSGFWIFLTAILWAVDILFLRFGGVNYNDLLSVIQSGGLGLMIKLVIPIYSLILLLIILTIKAGKSKKIIFFLIVVFVPLLIINHFAIDYNIWGISITFISLMVSMVVVAMSLKDRYDFFSWVSLILTFSLIISLGGLISGIHHLIVAGLIWLFLLKPRENWTRANFWISIVLIIDFFFYGLWQSFGPLQANSIIANRFIFPIWFLFVLVYTGTREGYSSSVFAKIVMFGVFGLYLVVLLHGAYGWESIKAQMQASPEEVAEAKSFFQDAFAKIKAFPGKIVEEYKRGMTEATGGYYQGKVEENQDPRNELGVHMDNLQAADKQFYQNEQVVVWGDLKAKTLDKPVYIYMSCKSGDAKGEIKPDRLADPEGYEIERLEEIPFECRFMGGQLKAGTNSIEVKAEFNFETLGYLKTYFIDIERMRALRKENIDPLRQYGIDKKPEAVYTNGPVRLGMGTVDPPVGLSTTSDGYSYIGVTIQPQWYGRIKKITNLMIQVPKYLEIEKEGEFYCRNDFEMEEEDIEGYSVYRMREEGIKKIKTPIDAYKSWRCSISIPSGKASEILGNTPVAVYYYRAGVDYIYEIEKLTNVYVKAVEGEKRELLDCKTECDDSDGCLCNADGCGIPKGESIGEGYTCDNYPSGSNVLRGYERTISDVDDATKFIDAYLVLNDLCAQGLSENAKKELGRSELEDEEKKEMGKLLEDCMYETKKINYIEPAESKMVDKIKDTVRIFENAKSLTLNDEQKGALKDKKKNFIEKIEKVKKDFERVKKYMGDNYRITVMDDKYYEALNKAKTDLEGITY